VFQDLLSQMSENTLVNSFNEVINVENMESIRQKLKTIDDFGIGSNDLEKRNIKAIITNYV